MASSRASLFFAIGNRFRRLIIFIYSIRKPFVYSPNVLWLKLNIRMILIPMDTFMIALGP